VTTDTASSARPLSRAHVKRAAATIVPEVRDVHDCDLETRSETDLRMSALRARGSAASRGEVEAESQPWRGTVFVFTPPMERNRPFRVNEYGLRYRKACRTGSCRHVAQHRGVDRMFQHRTCRAVEACGLTRFLDANRHPFRTKSEGVRRLSSGVHSYDPLARKQCGWRPSP
jgi:hypothetical protein